MDRFLLKLILIQELPQKQNFEENEKKTKPQPISTPIIQFLIELQP